MSIEGNQGTARFFHSTTARAAEGILASGFRDGEGNYGFDISLRGVFISEYPFDENEGAESSESLLEVRMSGSIDLSAHEIVDEETGHREWCIPASLINEHADVREVDKEEADELRFLLRLPSQWPDPCPSCGGTLQLINSPPGFREEIEMGKCPGCGLERHRLKA